MIMIIISIIISCINSITIHSPIEDIAIRL